MDPHATAGRVVHYYPIDGEQNPIAAHVNRETTKDGQAQLTVLECTGPRVIQRVMYSESPTPGCWTWMDYQRAKAASAEGNQSESAEPRPGGPMEVIDIRTQILNLTEIIKANDERIAELTQCVNDYQSLAERNDVVHGLLERVGSLEDLHSSGLPHGLAEPEVSDSAEPRPPLRNQAGEEIAGDEEVPDAAPVDLSGAVETDDA